MQIIDYIAKVKNDITLSEKEKWNGLLVCIEREKNMREDNKLFLDAVHSNNVQEVSRLLQKGVNVNICYDEETDMYFEHKNANIRDACRVGYVELVKLMLKYGADLDNSYLIDAVSLNKFELVDLFIEHGYIMKEEDMNNMFYYGKKDYMRQIIKLMKTKKTPWSINKFSSSVLKYLIVNDLIEATMKPLV